MIHASPHIMRLLRSPLDLAPGCALVSTCMLTAKSPLILRYFFAPKITDGMELIENNKTHKRVDWLVACFLLEHLAGKLRRVCTISSPERDDVNFFFESNRSFIHVQTNFDVFYAILQVH